MDASAVATDHALPTAYCARGRKAAAEITLAARGEQVAEVREHPFLEGWTDILLLYPDRLSDFLDHDPPCLGRECSC